MNGRLAEQIITLTAHEIEDLKRESDEDCCDSSLIGDDKWDWVCTRSRGHSGRHLAGIGSGQAVRSWDDSEGGAL